MNEVIDRKQTKHMFPSDFSDRGKTVSGNKNIANSFNNYFTSIGEDMANSIQDTEGFEKHLTTFGHLSFIAMKPMKKATNKDTEDIPHEEDEGNVKIQDGPVDKPEEEHPHIT